MQAKTCSNILMQAKTEFFQYSFPSSSCCNFSNRSTCNNFNNGKDIFKNCPFLDKNIIIWFQMFSDNKKIFNSLNAELNPICHLLTLFGAHHILNASRIRVNKGSLVTGQKHSIIIIIIIIDWLNEKLYCILIICLD